MDGTVKNMPGLPCITLYSIVLQHRVYSLKGKAEIKSQTFGAALLSSLLKNQT